LLFNISKVLNFGNVVKRFSATAVGENTNSGGNNANSGGNFSKVLNFGKVDNRPYKI